MDFLDSFHTFHETVLRIHSQDNSLELRHAFLSDIEKLIYHDKSIFDFACLRNNKIDFFDPISLNIEENYLKAYYKDFEVGDFMSWFFYQNEQSVYRDSDLITDAMRGHSLIYKNWMKPQNIHYSIGSRIARRGKLYGSITLFRSKESGDFTEAETQCLEYLNSHLALNLSKLYPNGIERTESSLPQDQLSLLYHLSKREAEVVARIYNGMHNKEIAEELFLSESTVKKHVYNIFKKMNIDSRSQLIKIVCDCRLISY